MRNLEFSGGSKEKIVVDSNEDIKIEIGAGSNITGIIQIPGNNFELNVTGGSKVELYGECKHLILKKVSGGSHVDLSHLYCQEATAELIDWGSLVILSVSNIIHEVCLKKGSMLQLTIDTPIKNLKIFSGSTIKRLAEEE